MRINTNELSLKTHSNMAKSQGSLSNAITRLSSGLRINSASDDAAGLAISNRMSSRIKGNQQAVRNSMDALSLLSTVEGGLSEINSILQRQRELVVQMRSDTNSVKDKASIAGEIDQLMDEIDRISGSTAFNGTNVLRTGSSKNIQIGSESQDSLEINLKAIDRQSLGLGATEPPPMGPALSEVTMTGGQTIPISFRGMQLPTGDWLEPEQTADYFGVALADITLHQVAPGTPGTSDNVMILNVGGKHSFVISKAGLGSLNYDTATGEGKVFISMDNRQARYIDPENGIDEMRIFPAHRELGKDGSGTYFQYYEYNGKYYQSSADVDGDGFMDIPFVVSGPNSNFLSIDTEDLLPRLDSALGKINEYRAFLGATMNRLESITNSLSNDTIAIEAAQSRIQDADYAVEVSEMTRGQILQQAGQAVLAQANQIPNGILSLLR